MRSNDDIYYAAVLARDHRFDGKFFVGVKSTGIYCRPICPAKPLRRNVEFFNDAAAAEVRGYRPCLRCRPESAPHSPLWIGKSATVQRALRLIAEHRMHELSEDQFAAVLGVSARHLRRLFIDELGKTPKQISDLDRLNFARKLITETPLPITEIALASGFRSLRRFNEAFRERFHRAPGELRRGMSADESFIQLSLAYRPPLEWPSLIQVFKSHEIAGVESIGPHTYERSFSLGGSVGAFRVLFQPENSELKLVVATTDTKSLATIVRRVRQMFDLDSDPLLIANAFASSKVLAKLYDKYPGLRVPRGWDAFETVICTILGQLVSTEQARRLIGHLVLHYGAPITNPFTQKAATLFPTPEILARASLAPIGTTQNRKNAIREFSRAYLKGEVNLSGVHDPTILRDQLLAIKGIGPWTAEYIALRAMGDTDAFPGSDLILKRVLEAHPKLNLDSLRPWRAYGAMYLWREFAGQMSRKKEHQVPRKAENKRSQKKN